MTIDDEQRLHRLASEWNIRNLIAQLGHLADDGDIDEYLDMWADGSTYHESGVRYTGRESQRRRIERNRADGKQGPGTDSLHLNTTLWVEFEDDHNARAESYYLILRAATSGSPQVTSTGRYWDRFRLTEDRWRFVERRKARDLNGWDGD